MELGGLNKLKKWGARDMRNRRASSQGDRGATLEHRTSRGARYRARNGTTDRAKNSIGYATWRPGLKRVRIHGLQGTRGQGHYGTRRQGTQGLGYLSTSRNRHWERRTEFRWVESSLGDQRLVCKPEVLLLWCKPGF